MNTNTNMDPLTKKVFERINNEHMTPRPRWEFLAKNYTLWGLGIVAVILGALAFAATLFEIQNVDWRLSSATHADFLSFFLASAPFIWVSALALFVIVSYINVRKTVHGYRYPFVMLALGAILLSLALGSVVYAMGFGGAIDESIGDHPPFYRPVLAQQRSLWLAPEKGVLTGHVTAIATSTSSFILQDFSGREWNVDSDDLRKRDVTLIAHDSIVRVVGLPVSATSSEFHACFVFSEMPRRAGATAANGPKMVKNIKERSDECKGIKPYSQLHAIEDDF